MTTIALVIAIVALVVSFITLRAAACEDDVKASNVRIDDLHKRIGSIEFDHNELNSPILATPFPGAHVRLQQQLDDLNAHLSALMAHLGLAWERVPEQPASLRVVDVRSTATRATASAVTVGDRITPTDMRNYKRGAKKAKR